MTCRSCLPVSPASSSGRHSRESTLSLLDIKTVPLAQPEADEGWEAGQRAEDQLLPWCLLTLLSKNCRGQAQAPRTLLPPAVHTFFMQGLVLCLPAPVSQDLHPPSSPDPFYSLGKRISTFAQFQMQAVYAFSRSRRAAIRGCRDFFEACNLGTRPCFFESAFSPVKQR